MTHRASLLGFALCASLAACASPQPAPTSSFGNAAEATPAPSGVSETLPSPATTSTTNTPSTTPTTPPTPATTPSTTPSTTLEVAAYYTGYGFSTLPLSKMDYSLVNELTHFAVVPHADGSLDDGTNMVDFAAGYAFTQATSAAHVRGTLSIGGAGSEAAFAQAATNARPTLVANIVQLLDNRNYDGVDIDWEPLSTNDAPAFAALIADLRAVMPANKTISVAAPVGSGTTIATAIGNIDRVHLMAYDLSGPYQGWVSWHNAPLSNGGGKFPSTGGALPSVSDVVDDFLGAGVPANKVMLGVDHQGYVWQGVDAPLLDWTVAPTMTPMAYRDIANLFTADNQKWDADAQVPYLSIDGTNQFVSYENDKSQQAKADFARQKGLVGLFVWDVAASYRATDASPLALLSSLHDAAE